MDDLVIKKGESKIFEKSTYTWTLEKFSELSKQYKCGQFVKSSSFSESGSEWYLLIKIYPKGKLQSKNNIGVYLYSDFNESVIAKFFLRLQTSNDEIICAIEGEKNFNKNTRGWGSNDIISLHKLKSSIEKDDILKIHAIVFTEVFSVQPNHKMHLLQENNSLIKLQCEFKTIFKSKEFSDFTIKLGDSTEIPVHKNILAARSPVFSAMFKNDTSEKAKGYTQITDVDENVMTLLLNFIYTGSVDSNLSVDVAEQLLAAADKYELLDLKQFCAENLKNNIKVSNVINILSASELYNLPELKATACKYIFQNAKKFCDIVIFEKLEEKFPRLLTELIVTIFKTFNLEDKESS